jgi:transposase
MPHHGRLSVLMREGRRMTEAAERVFTWFVGVDWATAAHQVCVCDATGAVHAERVVEHTGPALAAFVDWLTTVADGRLAQVAVAIEVPRGAVVETLMERGAAVFTLNPKQVDRFRDRVSVAGAKDDRRDAWVLASALRTDPHAFRRITGDDPRIIRLRELARADEDLAHEFNRLTNRLREQVYRVAPGWLALAPTAGEPWFWALLAVAPTPHAGRRLRTAAVAKLLRAHRIRRLRPDEVLAVVQAETVHVADGTVEAVAAHVALLLPRLQLVHAQRRQCAKDLEALLDTLSDDEPSNGADTTGPLSDVTIVRSVPGVGRVIASTLFAEAGAVLRLRDQGALRALGGLAPVTKQSGKRRTVHMRRACNGRLRDAFYHWARTSTLFDPASKTYYATLRARGHSHGRALRSVADRWLRILMAMLTNGTTYDPARPRTTSPNPLTLATAR